MPSPMPMEPWAAAKKALSYSYCRDDPSSCPIPDSKAAFPEFHVGYAENFSDHSRITQWNTARARWNLMKYNKSHLIVQPKYTYIFRHEKLEWHITRGSGVTPFPASDVRTLRPETFFLTKRFQTGKKCFCPFHVIHLKRSYPSTQAAKKRKMSYFTRRWRYNMFQNVGIEFINTFKYHVSCTNEKISVRIIYFYYPFFHCHPTHKLCFLSCRPFVVNRPTVDNCPSQETEETTRPVENIALTTKGLFSKNL